MMTVQRREQAHVLTYIFLLVVAVVACAPEPHKRCFSLLCVKLCEKNDATAQIDSANRTKSYARKSNAFACSSSGDEATQTFRIKRVLLTPHVGFTDLGVEI